MQIEELYNHFIRSSGISTDTRRIEMGNLFFALKGENFNGNLFAVEALSLGAALVIADEKQFPDNEKIVVVDDVLKTLQHLAKHHRQQLKSKVIAVGGSNGKTTTKELLARVLETTFRTHATQGNFNNHIGVPLTILSIRAAIEIAIIEMGANHIGETTLLCDIAEPMYGIITNNGKDHLEGYGNLIGVRHGNGELYEFLKRNDSLAFVSADHPDLLEMSQGLKKTLYGKNSKANVRGKITELYPFLKLQVIAGQQSTDVEKPAEGEMIDKESEHYIDIVTQLIGKYNFDNIMAAICIAKYFGVTDENIQQAISTYIPSNNRSQIVKKGSNTFLLDAYNANPSSMAVALESFALMPVKTKIVILGDMLELGNMSEQEHRELILNLTGKKFNQVIFVGEEFGKALAKINANYQHFKTVVQLKEWFHQQHFSDSFFLLKGSRLIGLERLLM